MVTSLRVRSSTAQRAGRASEPSGQRVGIVDRDEQAVHLVHQREQPLRLLPLVGAGNRGPVGAARCGFGHAVGRADVDPELGGVGNGWSATNARVRLASAILGVLEKPAVAHVVVPGEHVLRPARYAAASAMSARAAELLPVHRADGRRARS